MAAILIQRCSASKLAGHCQKYAPCVQSVHTRGTCRCNISLRHVPATFSCVCKCCDFVPATCPRYTSLLPVASVCATQVFVAAACRCDMSLQHNPSCLPTFKSISQKKLPERFPHSPIHLYLQLCMQLFHTLTIHKQQS